MSNTHLKTDAAGATDNFYLIPFQLGSEIVLKSTLNPALTAKTIVYGTVLGEMIIIEEPLFSLTGRFAGQSEEFLCAFMYGNHLLKFKSKFVKHLFKNVIGIDYPKDVERIQVRSSTRIPVNIETVVHAGTKDVTIPGRMADISEGGCRLESPGFIKMQKGSKFYLSFTLPENEIIDDLVCAVMNVRHLHDNTIVGVRFSGPPQAMMKVEKFYRLCVTALALGVCRHDCS
ncbi:MAG: PilZ domain-containing protein [Syntrophobacteraceae bacterium]